MSELERKQIEKAIKQAVDSAAHDICTHIDNAAMRIVRKLDDVVSQLKRMK